MLQPSTKRAETAAKAVFDRYVNEGHMTRREANKSLRDGLWPLMSSLAQTRLEGIPEEFTTASLQGVVHAATASLTEARGPIGQNVARLRLLAAEVALATWTGLLEDCAEYVASLGHN